MFVNAARVLDDLRRNWNDSLAVAALKVYDFGAAGCITSKRSNNNNNINDDAGECSEIIRLDLFLGL